MASTLNLHNNGWHAGCQTEVHTGNNANADLNPSLGVQNVADGAFWPIQMTANVQWRRERDQGQPTGQWTVWTEQTYNLDGQVYDVNL